MPTLEHLPEVTLPDYWIDRHEVTNRAFKQFVDDGGYRRAELWQEPFVKEGRTLTFAAAMAYFRDATGRPGPADWELSNYVAGHDDYPVTGVSWYEAAAYGRWAGKSLPTLYHWNRAAGLNLSGEVVPVSNFNGKSLLPVGASHGTTRGGTTDMAGNVKEWTLNADGEKRYILGGAWDEPVYMFTDPDAVAIHARPDTWFPLHQNPSNLARFEQEPPSIDVPFDEQYRLYGPQQLAGVQAGNRLPTDAPQPIAEVRERLDLLLHTGEVLVPH